MSCYLLELEISSFYTTEDDKATRWLKVKEFLFHANNVALAIASGIAIAVLVFEATHQADLDRLSKVYRAVQGIGVSIVAMMMQPAVYEAFLTVGALLADPFTNETHGLPMLDYVQDLRRQIGEMNALAKVDVQWLMDNSPGNDLHAAKSPFAKVVKHAILEMKQKRQEAEENPASLVNLTPTSLSGGTEFTPKSTPPLTPETTAG